MTAQKDHHIFHQGIPVKMKTHAATSDKKVRGMHKTKFGEKRERSTKATDTKFHEGRINRLYNSALIRTLLMLSDLLDVV